MKKRISIFVIGLIAVVLQVVLTAQTANALSDDHSAIAYYGKYFADNRFFLRNEELKEKIKYILRSGHISNSVANYDDLVESCDSKSNCRQQRSIGYDGAREFLFGKFYLIRLDNSYGVQDMYCNKVFTAADFKGGYGAPAPGVVPDGTVVNTEHTWPQSRFTGKYAKEMQKSDLHHLFPTDSRMNSLRGNTIFGEVVKDQGKTCAGSRYGQGQGTNRDVFEPPHEHKGRVARAIFYFSIRYDLPISSEEEVILKRWHKESPVDATELARNSEIQKIQGNRNPFIDYPELAEQIDNF